MSPRLNHGNLKSSSQFIKQRKLNVGKEINKNQYKNMLRLQDSLSVFKL